jgi:catechol 2,3-dioxygenase-like lactoylglutathione lyase family enzyme
MLPLDVELGTCDEERQASHGQDEQDGDRPRQIVTPFAPGNLPCHTKSLRVRHVQDGPGLAGYALAMTARLDVTEIVVADMARSLAFYRRLGFDVPAAADTEPHVEATLPGGLRVAWDTVETIRSFTPGWTPPSGSNRMSLGFACDDAADVDATFAALVAAGYEGHLQPWDAFWGQRYATLLDPDGNGVDLFAALPSDG